MNNQPLTSPASQHHRTELLDEVPPDGYLQQWTERVAAPLTHTELATESVAVFQITDEWLAVPTKACQEVAENVPVHSMPHRLDGLMLGLGNIRGDLIPFISLEVLLGLPPGERLRVYPKVLVLAHAGERVAFPVLRVAQVIRFNEMEMLTLPSTLPEQAEPFSKGLIRWNSHVAGYLDHELLFAKIGSSLL